MERWKDIPGYEGLYQASDLGNIRTCDGKVTSNARCPHRVWKQRVMKQKYQPRKSGDGKDARVCLWKDGKVATHLVSRLVALAWCEGYEPGLTVNHIDGDPTNNRSDNLEWMTHKENIQAAFRDNLYRSQRHVMLVSIDGSCTEFRSMASASRFLGKGNGYISMMLAKGKVRTPQGYTITTSD